MRGNPNATLRLLLHVKVTIQALTSSANPALNALPDMKPQFRPLFLVGPGQLTRKAWPWGKRAHQHDVLGGLELTSVMHHWTPPLAVAAAYGLGKSLMVMSRMHLGGSLICSHFKATASVAAYRLEGHGRTCLHQPELCASPSIYADHSSLQYILIALPFLSDTHFDIRTFSLVVLRLSNLLYDPAFPHQARH
jgi:hypothetical protein